MEETNKCSIDDAMEVKEEGQPPKWVKTKETVNSEEGEDRISLLPDRLIIDEILSRLDSTKQAIRTGTLSKRWQHLWTCVTNLIFHNIGQHHLHSRSDFYLSVDKTLTQCRHRQLKNLNKFRVLTSYDNRFESQVNNWIRFATNCNLQRLHLCLWNWEPENQNRFVMKDESFFINSYFTHIHLAGCIYNHPTGPISWNNLTSLSISRGKLDENLIANILSGSPLLDTLRLENCHGYSRLDITSKSVKNLVFSGYNGLDDESDEFDELDEFDDIIEINAPYVLSLTIQGELMLSKLLLLDVSSLVKANLDYTTLPYDERTLKEEEVMLKRYILHLCHVKELEIGILCYEVLSRLEDQGFIFPCNLMVPDVAPPLSFVAAFSMEETNKCSVDDAMEVKEEGQPPKWVKTKETVNSEGEDRISLLPDCLIIEILSRLEFTKYAIRTGTLSKRWLHLWTCIPNLIFHNNGQNHLRSLSDFYLAVDKTLSQCRHRQFKSLNKFSVRTNYDNRFQSQVNNWIRFATNCNVQQLHLCLWNWEHENQNQFVMKDESFFINSYFTHIHLAGCIYNHPTGPISWNNLTSFSISFGKLDENLIANILSGSPLLDTLRLENCHGYSRLDITSKSVKNLVFSGYDGLDDESDESDEFDDFDDIIEINAPYVLSLTIQGELMLSKLLLLDVSSLVKANLDYTTLPYDERTCKEEEVMLKTYILHLRHVKELEIGIHCYEAFSRLEDQGFIFPSNLMVPDVTPPLSFSLESVGSISSDRDQIENENGDLEALLLEDCREDDELN